MAGKQPQQHNSGPGGSVLHDRPLEPIREFQFRVSWSTLIACLQPIPVTDQATQLVPMTIPNPMIDPTPSLPAVIEDFPAETRNRWEMVVPKMDRPGASRPASKPRPRIEAPLQTASYHRGLIDVFPIFYSSRPLFAKFLSAVSLHTRLLIAGGQRPILRPKSILSLASDADLFMPPTIIDSHAEEGIL